MSSASDGLVKVWNVKDEECVTSLDGHEDKVRTVSFFPMLGTCVLIVGDRYGHLRSVKMRIRSSLERPIRSSRSGRIARRRSKSRRRTLGQS